MPRVQPSSLTPALVSEQNYGPSLNYKLFLELSPFLHSHYYVCISYFNSLSFFNCSPSHQSGRDRLTFLIFRWEIMGSKAIVPVKTAVERKHYPSALASHEEVVKNPSLFWDTLRIFHKTMGRKNTVPVIGGKELNLHVLYAEVTKKGGFDKVVSQKKWREVSSVFEFAPTTTSASYALRKHYFSLLYHYEQAYFFRQKGPMLDSPGPLCFQAVGTIDGKFDCGYLVSVKLGSEILNGVLYHPGHPGPSSSSTVKPSTAIVPYTPQARGSGRRKRKKRGDPGRPKPNRSGYNFYFAEKHSMLKSLYPNREREVTKIIGESWNNLTPEERTVYQDFGLKDKERYQREMKEYKERMNSTISH